ncbi:hypothetical protein JCM11491_002492 [Sporobolomyces phaffii]
MTPIASTSSPNAFPPPATPASTPQRSRLSRKGKEKAVYTPPSYDFDDPSQGLYQPRSGQLQRKKTPRLKSKLSSPAGGSATSAATRARRRQSNAEGVLGVETITIGAAVEKDLERERAVEEEPIRKKRKRQPSSPASKRLHPSRVEEPDPSSQPDPSSPSTSFRSSDRRAPKTIDDAEQRKLSKKKKKKTVRLELPPPLSSTSSSSDNEYGLGDNDTFRLDSEDDRNELARSFGAATTSPVRSRRRTRSIGALGIEDFNRAEAGEEEARDDPLLDYANPLNLPRTTLGNQQRRTSRKYWRGLEYGVYRSALYDAVAGEHGENDLGKLTRRRTRSNTGYSSGPGFGDGEDETGEGRLAEGVNNEEEEDDDDDEPTLALPTSRVLSEMARWPLYPAELINYAYQSGQRYDLHEELEILADQTRREARRAAPEPHRRSRYSRKIPSAYSANGPFAIAEPDAPESDPEQSSSDAESDFSTASLSPPPVYPPSFLSIPATISSVLTRLSDFVPKEPLPALDIWSVRLREEGMRLEREACAIKDAEEKGDTSSQSRVTESVPGWREVVAVARENEAIPKHVVDSLEARLKKMYEGPLEETSCEPVTLPPLGGSPAFPTFEPRKKKPRNRKKRSKVAPTTQEAIPGQVRDSVNGPPGDAGVDGFERPNGPDAALSGVSSLEAGEKAVTPTEDLAMNDLA